MGEGFFVATKKLVPGPSVDFLNFQLPTIFTLYYTIAAISRHSRCGGPLLPIFVSQQLSVQEENNTVSRYRMLVARDQESWRNEQHPLLL
jgi:hypothetical protein